MPEVVLTRKDALRCRFAISPLWETGQVVRTLRDVQLQAFHLPWLSRVQNRAAALDLDPLLALQPASGCVPDFVCPPPQRLFPDIDEELDEVRSTPPEVVTAQLTRCLENQHDPQAREYIEIYLHDPVGARDQIASLLRTYWAELVEADWPRIRALLEADIAFRARNLTEAGLGPVLDAIDPKLSFMDGSLRVASAYKIRYDLEGSGIILQPSAFAWPQLSFGSGPWHGPGPWQPTLIYPARGIANLWQSDGSSAALGRLIGNTRAILLAGLIQPASTLSLAQRHALSPSGVSAHLKALRDAGLVSAQRHRREVLYTCTPLGLGLLGADRDVS